jgi:hypothetical protein
VIYQKCAPAIIQELILQELVIAFVMDNYNKTISKRFQTDETSAIMHIGTASSLIRQIYPGLPVGSTVKSALGVTFIVLQTVNVKHNMNSSWSWKWMNRHHAPSRQKSWLRYKSRCQWQSVSCGWLASTESAWSRTTTSVTYIDQHISTMLKLRVHKSLTDNDLLFANKRNIKFEEESTVPLEVSRYHTIIAAAEARQSTLMSMNSLLLLGGTFLAAPVLSLRLRLTGFLEALLLR